MKIKGKSIRTLSKVLNMAGAKKNIRLAIPFDKINNGLLMKLGFDAIPMLGDYLIPSSVGRYTRFNANGLEKVRKDLPKQPESIMYLGTNRDWQGGLHSGIKTRTIEKYPRDYISAPSEALYVIEINGRRHVASRELHLNDQDETRNIHVCNLMLECFSEFEILDTETGEIVGPALKRVQWDILPKGEYPWDVSKPIVERITKNLDPKDKEVIEHRMRVISQRKPDFLATGRGGFWGYFVYGFVTKGVYVLESIHLDNATYLFNGDWESLSQLTKSQIINGDLPHLRIVHNKKWHTAVSQAIDNEKI